MACNVLKLPNGGTAIICGRRMRKRNCAHCGRPDAKSLCDWPTGEGKTCDKPCCFACRIHVDTDRDYCADHWGYMRAGKAQRELFA
jgi:hypothetical protein